MRPLRMFFGLRPVPESFWSSEQLLDPFGSKGGQLPVDIGLPSRATARRLIDHIDSIALTDEEIRPARSPIGRTHPVRRGLCRAVDQHERKGMASLARPLS